MTYDEPPHEDDAPRSGLGRFLPRSLVGGLFALLIAAGALIGFLSFRPSGSQLSEPVDVPVRVEQFGNEGTWAATPETITLDELSSLSDFVVQGVVRNGNFRVTHIHRNEIGGSVALIAIELTVGAPGANLPLEEGAEYYLFLDSVRSPNSEIYRATERLFATTLGELGQWRVSDGAVRAPGVAGAPLREWGGRGTSDFSAEIEGAPDPRTTADTLLDRHRIPHDKPDQVTYQVLAADPAETIGAEAVAASRALELKPEAAAGKGVIRLVYRPGAYGDPGVAKIVLVRGDDVVAAWLELERSAEVFPVDQYRQAQDAADAAEKAGT